MLLMLLLARLVEAGAPEQAVLPACVARCGAALEWWWRPPVALLQAATHCATPPCTSCRWRCRLAQVNAAVLRYRLSLLLQAGCASIPCMACWCLHRVFPGLLQAGCLPTSWAAAGVQCPPHGCCRRAVPTSWLLQACSAHLMAAAGVQCPPHGCCRRAGPTSWLLQACSAHLMAAAGVQCPPHGCCRRAVPTSWLLQACRAHLMAAAGVQCPPHGCCRRAVPTSWLLQACSAHLMAAAGVQGPPHGCCRRAGPTSWLLQAVLVHSYNLVLAGPPPTQWSVTGWPCSLHTGCCSRLALSHSRALLQAGTFGLNWTCLCC
ncbi:putative protein CRIPAK [Portunus trituberculatus]|uniref:putative protein CRIPAK n=1 Tax=Portunus trituberculatus TaxID=210409 RepID=UPI001E1CC0F6|nr:putative protein CRIPAK [Portunus trituberculatus]